MPTSQLQTSNFLPFSLWEGKNQALCFLEQLYFQWTYTSLTREDIENMKAPVFTCFEQSFETYLGQKKISKLGIQTSQLWD